MRNNCSKILKNPACQDPRSRSQKKGSPAVRATGRATTTPGSCIPAPRHIATRVSTGFTGSGVQGARDWSGRFGFISTRAPIGRPRGYRLFAFCPRNDVLRVSAYMQPSDRAWQIGFAPVSACAHRPPQTRVVRRRGVLPALASRPVPPSCPVHTYRKQHRPLPRSSEDTSRGGLCVLPASQMGLRHAAQPRRPETIYTCMYALSLVPSTNRRDRRGEAESPDRDPQISRKK